MKRLIVILLSTLLLSSCGFHPRRAADIPAQLRTLYIQTKMPYSEFITRLKDMLQALDIRLTKYSNQAPYTLEIDSIHFQQSNPAITTTSLAVTITYSLSIKVSLTSKSGKKIISERALSASRSLSQNPSQVYTPGTATLAKQELRRDVISQLFYLLTSNETKNALDHAKK